MTDDFEPKHRKFRWSLEVPGIQPFTISKVEMPNGHRMRVNFFYVNDMEVGSLDIPITHDFHEGTLKLLNADGDVIRTGRFKFTVEDYVPITELDYASSDFIQGQVVLWVLNPIIWS